MKHSMQLLQEAAAKNGPLCVGLDTNPSYIPENILSKYQNESDAVFAYNLEIIKRVASERSASCFKVQIAYYESMGIEGLKAYAKTLKAVKDAGFISIADIKRGDIAATADAYAKAHFSGDFEADIITVNPYMGFDTLKPFTKYCAEENGAKGIFVLLRTSNPGMKDIEQEVLENGGRVLDKVGNELRRISDEAKKIYTSQTCSPVGAVVGCTEERDARLLRNAYPDVFFLIPGYGAQGGDAKICATLLDKASGVVNSSRGILCAWKKDNSLAQKKDISMEEIADAASKACIDSKLDLVNAVKKSL